MQREFSGGEDGVERFWPVRPRRSGLGGHIKFLATIVSLSLQPKSAGDSEGPSDAPIEVLHRVDGLRIRPHVAVEHCFDLVRGDDGAAGHHRVARQLLDHVPKFTTLPVLVDLRDLDVDRVGDRKHSGTATSRPETDVEYLSMRRATWVTSQRLGEFDPVIEVEVDELRRARRGAKRLGPDVRNIDSSGSVTHAPPSHRWQD